jgi:hypothetical protein
MRSTPRAQGRFRRQDIDLETEAEAKTLASIAFQFESLKLRIAVQYALGLVTPPPAFSHRTEDER